MSHTISHTGEHSGSRAPICHHCGHSTYDCFIDGQRVPLHVYLVAGQPIDTGPMVDFNQLPLPEWLRAVLRLPEPRIELCAGCAILLFGTPPEPATGGEDDQHELDVEDEVATLPADHPHTHRMIAERRRVAHWMRHQIGAGHTATSRPPRPSIGERAAERVRERQARLTATTQPATLEQPEAP